jgi:hypothetical protein
MNEKLSGTRAGSMSIIFVDVGYRFFSIIFDDFDCSFDVDFFIIAISISIIFSQSCIYGFGDHVTWSFNGYIKITMFYSF